MIINRVICESTAAPSAGVVIVAHDGPRCDGADARARPPWRKRKPTIWERGAARAGEADERESTRPASNTAAGPAVGDRAADDLPSAKPRRKTLSVNCAEERRRGTTAATAAWPQLMSMESEVSAVSAASSGVHNRAFGSRGVYYSSMRLKQYNSKNQVQSRADAAVCYQPTRVRGEFDRCRHRVLRALLGARTRRCSFQSRTACRRHISGSGEAVPGRLIANRLVCRTTNRRTSAPPRSRPPATATSPRYTSARAAWRTRRRSSADLLPRRSSRGSWRSAGPRRSDKRDDSGTSSPAQCGDQDTTVLSRIMCDQRKGVSHRA